MPSRLSITPRRRISSLVFSENLYLKIMRLLHSSLNLIALKQIHFLILQAICIQAQEVSSRVISRRLKFKKNSPLEIKVHDIGRIKNIANKNNDSVETYPVDS
jgi:hypothetical protein